MIKNKLLSYYNTNKRIILKKALIVFLIFCISFIAIINSPTSIWRNASDYTDTWVFQTIAYTMEKGGMPYLDSFDHKGPLLFIINYLGMRLNFSKGVWIIELLFVFGTFLILYKIARLFCRKITALASVLAAGVLLITFFSGGNYTEEYAMLFIAATLYIFLDFFINQKVSKLRWAICGACFACVCMLRPNMIAIWMVFCSVTFFSLIKNKKWKPLKDFVLFFIIGFLVTTLPVIIWLAAKNALTSCFEQYILFNLQYSTDNTRATNENRWNTLFYFCQSSIMVLVLAISAWICLQRNQKDRTIGTIHAAYLVLSLLLICISGQSYGHYGLILVPAIVFPLAYLLGHIEKHTNHANYHLVSAIGIYVFASLVAPIWLTQIKNTGTIYKHRHESQVNQGIQQIIDYIQETTTQNDKISVYGNMDMFYILARRLPASRYSYQYPIGSINPQIMDKYFEDLNEYQPAIIIIRKNADDNYYYQLDTQKMENFLSQNQYICNFETIYDKGKLLVYEKNH